MNREPGQNESGAVNQPRANERDDAVTAADDAVAGVNLDDLADLGPRAPAETDTSASEALAEAVRRALKEGAMTYWLDIKVEVVDGVVRLHGRVDYYEDAEAAEAVASRVPGVRYVQDDLAIERIHSEG